MGDGTGPAVTGPAARRLWEVAEAVHAIAYFDRGARRAVRAAGAPGFWAGYFGTRLAPLRTADPWLASAVLYVFARPMVAQHLPAPADGARWDTARRQAVRDALVSVGGDAAPPAAAWSGAGEQARRLAEACEPAGRPLFAAHAGLPWPDDPWLGLWHGVTLLREYRGDGHLHVLAGEGLSGCEAMVLALRWRGHGDRADESAGADRGWDAGALATAYMSLAERGWVGPDRRLTEAGARARSAIEGATDDLATPRDVPADAIEGLTSALAPLADLTLRHIPRLNPIGITGRRA